MALSVGLVGLPNVGKSTLFNAVTSAGAAVANFPFCTIEPNVGVVAVPDARLTRLAELQRPHKVTATTLELVDIAGLVAGASTGEGLGNQFLARIREVDAICHVIRCFDEPDVVHVAGEVDPARDIEVVTTELLLKDLETVARRLERGGRAAKSGDRALLAEVATLERLHDHLDGGRPARTFDWQEARGLARELALLSAKPVLHVANVAEPDLPDGGVPAKAVRQIADGEGAEVVVVSARVEAELAELPPGDRADYLRSLGLEASGLERLIAAAYALLGLITFFTLGDELRAWTLRRGATAPDAAGEVHTDMRRGFIRAEVIAFDDFERLGSEAAARDAGRLRSEGKHYVVADGDVMHFRFNV